MGSDLSFPSIDLLVVKPLQTPKRLIWKRDLLRIRRLGLWVVPLVACHNQELGTERSMS